ncbi:LysR family transcriptional regulator [Enterococcus sp. JM4C]|uniref:LysR family transcriptional regulator n=1 Tax=Candidatus Enterococcus huntleyi TaxID=1857217 RepID=UPI00137A7A35|nr:LysR family transcriptional regulator [Enterococcus sp. JM4C]KAF1296773.1 LysR family transcriptional regulator [Enterococcus sp. JM4C]
MDIRVLNYFLTVAREGSMTGASRLLHVSQPTLSKQIKDLEIELGKKLFIRTNHRIKLTDEGLLLKKRAEDIVDMFEKTKNEFMTLDDISGGDIYIGAAETDAFKFFARTAVDLRQQYPSMRYHLFSGNSFEVTERLDRGLDDFGIVVDPVDLSNYHYLSLPDKNTWGVVMRADSPLAEKDAITIDDLLDLPLIVSRQANQQKLSTDAFTQWFGNTFEKLNIVATYSLAFNSFIMVREGFGYALAFDGLVNSTLENGLVFRPLKPNIESGLYIIWKKHQVFSPSAEIFLEAIKEKLDTL